jgi:hypothetical protein
MILVIASRMSWKRRLIELTIAGGLLASGCSDGPTIPVCNANPDPCCSAPDSQACIDYRNRDMTVVVPPDMSARDMTSHD